ncbi:MAG: RNA polymerase sigma factor [Gemmatimonadetes bacterium]|nr:RNA polymerase sigma factor [Gemmatimonadota bacterium]
MTSACADHLLLPPTPSPGDFLKALQTFILREDSEGESSPDLLDLAETDLAAAVAASPESFLVLYERYYSRVLNYLYRRTGDRDLAEDLTSRTFLQALTSLQRRSQRVCFRAWIYRIATNVHLSHGRTWSVWISRMESVGREWLSRSTPAPDAAMLAHSNSESVRRHLERLPDADRTALILRYYEELPYDDIAAIMNISPVGARSRVMRALRRLEERLRGEEGP